jgi:succinate dehydrogenase / fumarate reductase cytochrome b subunit
MNRILALWQTAIGKKVAMAVSGVLLVLFLVSHMISNVTVLIDPRHLDDYAAWLRSFGPLLWVARLGLLLLAVIHIAAAWQLTQMARAARPASYARHDAQVATYAARTMRWGGVLLLVFLVYHLLHLTFGSVHPDFRHGEVGRNLIVGMQSPVVAVFYMVSMLALGLHFWHGTWSVFQTLGANHPAWNRTRNLVAVGLAVLVAGGLFLIPLAALFGQLTWPPR